MRLIDMLQLIAPYRKVSVLERDGTCLYEGKGTDIPAEFVINDCDNLIVCEIAPENDRIVISVEKAEDEETTEPLGIDTDYDFFDLLPRKPRKDPWDVVTFVLCSIMMVLAAVISTFNATGYTDGARITAIPYWAILSGYWAIRIWRR